MTRQDLDRLIRDLQDVLSAGTQLDEETLGQMRSLATDLEQLSAVPAAREGLRARLAEGVGRFEASHPALSRSLANLIDALALYGL